MIKKFLITRLCNLIVGNSSQFDVTDRIESMINSIVTFTPIAIILSGLELWFKDNQMFFSFVIIAIMFNMLLGGIMHWKKGDFNLETFLIKTITMLIVVLISYVLLEFLVQIVGVENATGILFEKTIQVATILYPTGKCFKNVYILSDGKHPPEFIMNKIYNFQKTGDLNDFIKSKENGKEGN